MGGENFNEQEEGEFSLEVLVARSDHEFTLIQLWLLWNCRRKGREVGLNVVWGWDECVTSEEAGSNANS
jgi:hypothetical protein